MSIVCRTMAVYDVLIIGGGIAGLYTAWRLGQSTDLRIALLEADSRFGGRFQTCIMPGAFAADLGAMRFIPVRHPILYQLIQQLGLKTEKFFNETDLSRNSHCDYFKNQHVKGLEDLKNLYSVKDDDLQYFDPAQVPIDFRLPPNSNVYEAEVAETGQLAKDMSMSQYLSMSMNPEVINKGITQLPLMQTLATFKSRFSPAQQTTDINSQFSCVIDGMEQIIKALVLEMSKLPNVELISNAMVTRIDEANMYTAQADTQFTVQVDTQCNSKTYQARKIIFACNARGMELISWNSPHNRTTEIQKLLPKVIRLPAVKVFLTYKSPWWEKAGLVCGNLYTDLPIACVSAFGAKGKTETYATILAAFTYKNIEIFDGLNQSSYTRFVNSCGDVPDTLIPSELLVDYVQRQLKLVFGVMEAPTPVCAAVKIWSTDPIDAAAYHQRVGVDAYRLQWKVLKPFPDAHVYITGDTFLASTIKGNHTGWSEGALLNSERLITNYFHLPPYVSGIPMKTEI